MGLGRLTRQAARLFALVAALSATTGCRWLPVHQVDPTIWPGRSETEPSEHGSGDAELPQLPDLKPAADPEPFEPTPTATPMLDAAWERLQTTRDQEKDASPPAPIVVPKSEVGSAEKGSTEPDFKSPGDDQVARLIYQGAHAPRSPKLKPLVDDQIARTEAVTEAPTNPWEDWNAGLARLRAIAHDRASSESDDGGTWNVRERVLSRMSDATQDGEGDLWRFVLSALAAPVTSATTAEPINPSADEAALNITELQLCQRVRGFGSYEPTPSSSMTTDEPKLLYWEVVGATYEGAAPKLRSRLWTRLEILPANDGDPLWRQDLGTIEDSCRRPRRDFYMNYRLKLPKTLAAGDYRLRLTLRDEISGRQVDRFTPLTVHASR
jgi:hypothetical protein